MVKTIGGGGGGKLGCLGGKLPPCPRPVDETLTATHGFNLYLLKPRQCDDIGGGVPTLGTPNSSCSYHLHV